MYKTLYNDPVERSQYTYGWVYWDNGFTNDELQTIVDFCGQKGAESSSIIGSSEVEQVEKVRVSTVKFHKRDDQTAWIFDRFNDIVTRLNERFYGFNLNGYETFQYTEYHGSDTKPGRYDWHMDTELGKNTLIDTRKLSVVLNLTDSSTDYSGGLFQLNTGNENTPETIDLPKGRVIAFPSFMIHRVTPVTNGIRKSLVIWVTGPKFQ